LVVDGAGVFRGKALPSTARRCIRPPRFSFRQCRRPKVWQQRLAGDQQAAAHEHGGSQPLENSDDVELERAAWADARPLRHWSWLGSLAEMIVTLWTYWRREREIRRAVAALAEYDDRTLRDLGICGRSDIERVVRYCGDC
jgi:uncharacterized protein YjiS (DUF1127 family)